MKAVGITVTGYSTAPDGTVEIDEDHYSLDNNDYGWASKLAEPLNNGCWN